MIESISAQVILKWSEMPSGSGSEPITSDNIGDYRLDPLVIKEMVDFFSTEKFETGAVVANNFSITAPKSHFQRFFKVKIRFTQAEGCFRMPGKSRLLPLRNLPDRIERQIEAVTFVEPPQLF